MCIVELSFLSLRYYLFLFFCSNHHQSFDPFQGQKESSFEGLQDSAVSLAQFLCHAIDTPADDEGTLRNVFDTLLQVHEVCTKTVTVKKLITFNCQD